MALRGWAPPVATAPAVAAARSVANEYDSAAATAAAEAPPAWADAVPAHNLPQDDGYGLWDVGVSRWADCWEGAADMGTLDVPSFAAVPEFSLLLQQRYAGDGPPFPGDGERAAPRSPTTQSPGCTASPVSFPASPLHTDAPPSPPPGSLHTHRSDVVSDVAVAVETAAAIEGYVAAALVVVASLAGPDEVLGSRRRARENRRRKGLQCRRARAERRAAARGDDATHQPAAAEQPQEDDVVEPAAALAAPPLRLMGEGPPQFPGRPPPTVRVVCRRGEGREIGVQFNVITLHLDAVDVSTEPGRACEHLVGCRLLRLNGERVFKVEHVRYRWGELARAELEFEAPTGCGLALDRPFCP